MPKVLYLHKSQASNNVHTLDESIIGRFKLVGFCFTNNIYNVTDNNNKIYLRELANDVVVTLTNGFYDPSDFVTELSDVLNNGCVGTINVVRDTKTNKLTITNTFSFYFTFGSNTNNSARKLLGFDETDGSGLTSQTSENAIDLNPYKDIFLDISQVATRNVNGKNYFKTTFIVNGNGTFGEIFRYIPNDNFEQYVCFKEATKKIEIKIHDLNNNSIDLNSDYSLILKQF